MSCEGLLDEMHKKEIKSLQKELSDLKHDFTRICDREINLLQELEQMRRESKEDMVLVPREPTAKMRQAGWEAIPTNGKAMHVKDVYKAMINAAEHNEDGDG